MATKKLISMREVAKHNKQEDCWVAFHGKVYNLTDFIDEHPGGQQPLIFSAGKDGTKEFEKIHPKSILNILPPSTYLGDIDPGTVTEKDHAHFAAEKKDVKNIQEGKPPLDTILNVFDFENIASKVMSKEGWDYYSSGADDEITLRENHNAYHRIWLRPRVLVNVKNIDIRSKILGFNTSFPVYITACAMGKLAHPDGELALTRAAGKEGIVQMCPTLASYSLEEMMEAKQPEQIQFLQLYVNEDREITKDVIKRAEKGGCRALCITVDAPQLGRREKDMRNKFSQNKPNMQKGDKVNRNQGVARAISKFINPALSWDDLAWFRSITKMPIILKGIQCGEDAILAVQHSVRGIILSNHGGRQLDFARSGIEILPEVMSALKSINAEKKIEVWVDGGIRRGTDIFKALALGATAVGIGRPTLYGLAAYGQEGVERVIQILKEEFTMTMSLMGCPTISHINPEMVITKNLSDHVARHPKDSLSDGTYVPLVPISFSKL